MPCLQELLHVTARRNPRACRLTHDPVRPGKAAQLRSGTPAGVV